MSFKLSLGRGKPKNKVQLTVFDKFTEFAFRIFSSPSTRLSRNIPLLRDNILKSNIRITPEGLISVALFFTLVSGIIAAIAVYVGFVMYQIPYFLAMIAVVPLTFVIIINVPKFSSSGRASAINTELPFVIGYISVLAGGGVSPLATLRRISTLKLFPASAKEAKRILLDVDIFGQDPITAIESVARWNPSRRFSEFLFGYTAILKSGGNFMAYVQSKLRDVMENKASEVKRSADTTGTMAEAYLTVTVILGMVLYTLYMIQTLISHNLSALYNLYFFSFVIVPLISVGFIWLIDAVQPKWPFVDYRPYKYFIYTAPAAAIFFFLPLGLHIYLKTSIALMIGASIPAIVAMRYSRERRALERMLPEFIRDVAEGRKTGLSPEVAIERLGTRHYGVLSKHVKKMGAQLSWGVELSKVVSTFTSAVGSWITRAIGVLLIEVVDVGGGTIRSFSDMAEFTRSINDMESERRAALRPFVYITYVAGIMVILTTFIMVYLIAAPAIGGISSNTAPTVDPGTIDLLLTTAVFDSFVIGIVAGKMGESGITDGFKHGIFLVIASLIAINIARFFISIPV
ncbi:MAG TPA: type II secretion system F family protein [Nitrososphaerales archaeon]|nr:type II secretion system F family protein [Nitrososphaerales archaeon]